jgi:hypothetical protein
MKKKDIGENRLKLVYLKEIETEELDFVLYDEIFGKDWEDRERDIVEKKKGMSWGGDAIPISLHMLKNHIEQIEKTGATHVEIMYHQDHHSYVFN